MGLISEYVEIKLGGRNIKYYENLGYEIPRYMNKNKDMVVANGTIILVKISDLMPSSSCVVKIQCDNCGKITKSEYRYYLKHNHNLKTYCNKCSLKLFNSGENHPNWGNKYTPTGENHWNWGNKYTPTGENHPNWNPNLTQTEREQSRNYPQYTEFIKKVMNRDNYTCQCCGNKLNNDGIVHHLDGYNWCVEKRTDETNGITLCENCHKNFHSVYGYGNNTKEQFEEWIGHAIGELEKYNGKLPTARKIYCIEENRIYNNAKECAEYFNLKTVSEIYKICNHTYGRNVCKNKHLLWYDEYINMTEEDIRDYLLKYKDKNAPKKVYQYDKDYTLIKIWNSTNEPKKLGYNYSSSNISVHCKNGKIYKGYYWSYNLIPKK